jgi:hypothetical protein
MNQKVKGHLLYILVVKGPRRATLAVHRLNSHADLREFIDVYHALGFSDESLQVCERDEEQAA